MIPTIIQCISILAGSYAAQLFHWEDDLNSNLIGIVGGFLVGYPIMALLNGFRCKEGSTISHYDWLLYRLYCWRWNPILERNPAMKELIISWLKASDIVDDGTKVKINVTIEPGD